MMMHQACFLLAAITTCETLAFTSLISNRSRRLATLKSSPGYNEDLSGGIFFDGPTDFKSAGITSSSPSEIQLQKGIPGKQKSGNKRSKPNAINTIPKDIVIIGAGLAGLSAAMHISLNSNRQVTIIEKEDPFEQMEKTTAGSFAAAGMLAPQSERLPSGPLLDLCMESRDMYTDFVQTIESITANCGDDAVKHLWVKNVDGCDLQPWEVGYSATGGFLAPAFAGDSVATWSPPAQKSGAAKWLDDIQVHEMEPSLHPDVIGGWWFPEDASVDARRLTCALRASCVERGVQFMWGESCAAGSLELGGGKCKGIKLGDGRILSANSVVVANGSWMRNLLPVPITPHKGQSFSLRMPKDTEPVLSRVLFAQDTYIVPKADGRIVVGATVEAGSFDPNVTPAGLMHCMSNALQLVPGLADLPVEETWAGLRPTTPDKGPILGRTSWDNLFIAGGYWRNGVLLAPKTGQLIGDLVLNGGTTLDDEEDEILLEAFKWDRFTESGGGTKLAANARYAASMYPVHKRSSGMGVAAAVGTELGFYSGAADAGQERQKDRESLFQDIGVSGSEDAAFEKAAMQGMTDATAFSYESKVEKPKSRKTDEFNAESVASSSTELYDGSPDALTVGIASAPNEMKKEIDTIEDFGGEGLDSVYNSIRKNKAQASKNVEMTKADKEERTDPGFRVYHVDSVTRKETEIPPYTSPEALFSQEETEENVAVESENLNEAKVEKASEEEDAQPASLNNYDEKTFDGYQTIQNANSRESRDEELKLMREARIANRKKGSEIDPTKIGVNKADDDFGKSTEKEDLETNNEDLSEIYSAIKANKEAAMSSGLTMQDGEVDERPDPGFRVYHVDSVTREETEIPPYTSPQSVLKKKKAAAASDDSDSQPWGE